MLIVFYSFNENNCCTFASSIIDTTLMIDNTETNGGNEKRSLTMGKYNYFDDDYDFYEEKRTYERYNGSYAQDVEGWSDQDIDDVFDGDPDAYWNID